jgi:hypothetical protein
MTGKAKHISALFSLILICWIEESHITFCMSVSVIIAYKYSRYGFQLRN